MKDKERYLNCKYLDAGMDGMLCSMDLCITCKEFNGEKCSYYTPKNKMNDKEKHKQLEEIAKVIDSDCYGCMDCDVLTRYKRQDGFDGLSCSSIKKAEDCYKIAIPENAVVLEQEDYDNLVERAEYAERELALKLNSLEDKVVLTREEYEQRVPFDLYKMSRVIYNEKCAELAQARKETAREIIQGLYKVLWDESTPIANTFVNVDVKMRELAKQYGVEIKE